MGVGRGGRLSLTRTAYPALQVRTPFFLRTQVERVAGALLPGAEGPQQRLRRQASSAAAAAASPEPPSSTLLLRTVCRNARVSPFIKLSLANPWHVCTMLLESTQASAAGALVFAHQVSSSYWREPRNGAGEMEVGRGGRGGGRRGGGDVDGE